MNLLGDSNVAHPSQGNRIRRNELLICIGSATLWLCYVSTFLFSNSKYVNLQWGDFLAMIDALFPYFNLITLSLGLLCVACVIYKIENEYLRIELLVQSAITFWVTPFYLTGYVANPDTLFHGGVSAYAPQALSGTQTFFSNMYMAYYPGSFVFNWIFMNILGVDVPTYGRLIFPTLFSASIVLLIYLFGSRIFGRKIAFFSTFLTVLGLYYVEIHVSPDAVGEVLVLTTLCFIGLRNVKGLMLSIILVGFLVITHPESPLLLCVFLGAELLTQRAVGVYNKYASSLFSLMLVTMPLWFAWGLFNAITTVGTLAVSISLVVSFLLGFRVNESLLPSSTLYPLFGMLRSYLLYSYGALALALAFWSIKIGRISRSRHPLRNLWPNLYLILCATLFFLVTYLLRTTTAGGINLAQRGIFYLIICLSLLIASPLANVIEGPSHRRRLVIAVMIVFWVAANGFIYPLASYYAYAGGSYSHSEGLGTEFLTNINVDSNQILDFTPSEFTVVSMLPIIHFVVWHETEVASLKGVCVDIAIFHRTDYFYSANQELSFSNNSYTRSYSAIQSIAMNRIYSNPSYEVFTRPSSCG